MLASLLACSLAYLLAKLGCFAFWLAVLMILAVFASLAVLSVLTLLAVPAGCACCVILLWFDVLCFVALLANLLACWLTGLVAYWLAGLLSCWPALCCFALLVLLPECHSTCLCDLCGSCEMPSASIFGVYFAPSVIFAAT